MIILYVVFQTAFESFIIMAIITLTSDWGTRDHYLAAVKGTILKYLPDASIIDIGHTLTPFDLLEASFIIRNSYPTFPEKTIHIIALITEASLENPHIAVMYNEHYFIGADNGIFSLIFDAKPQQIVELDLMQDSDYFTFPERDVFAKAAALIAQGTPLDKLGSVKDNLHHRLSLQPVIDASLIKGAIIYVDNYGNAITNITKPIFKKVGKGRRFIISFKYMGNEIEAIHSSYMDVLDGEKLALFGTTGFLEVAINQGNASGLLGLKLYDAVRIEFFDN